MNTPDPRLIQNLIAADAIEDASERYVRQFEALDALALDRGFRMYNRNMTWFHDATFWELWRKFRDWRRCRPERKYMLWALYRSVAHLAPATAECGVYLGGSSFLIAREGERRGVLETHYGFDSFEGLSEPTGRDHPEDETAYAWSAGDLAVDADDVADALKSCSCVRLLKGWIPDRFDEVADDETFSFVHVDVDLHEPTRDSIEFFFPRLAPGGILLCDDYGSDWCPGARAAMNEFQQANGLPPVVDLGTGQGMLVKPA